jgi:hypothetical protein
MRRRAVPVCITGAWRDHRPPRRSIAFGRTTQPAWEDLIEFLAGVIDYREAVRRGDLAAAEAATERLAIFEAGTGDLPYDGDEFGFFESIWTELIPDHGIIDDLVAGGDLEGAGERLDRLITDLEATLDHGQPMRIVGWLGEDAPVEVEGRK